MIAENKKSPGDGVLIEGIVFARAQGLYTVHNDGRTILCAASSKLRKRLVHRWSQSQSPGLHRSVMDVREIEEMDPVAIGDRVSYIVGQSDAGDAPAGMIVEVLPRRNRLSRLSPGPIPREQVIIANVDLVVAVFSARQPQPKWRLLDRYLAGAEAAGVPAIVCITKADLLRGDDRDIHEAVARYRSIGYPTILTSAVTREGLPELVHEMSGRINVLVGKSGVGKTSLLNALQPGLGLRISQVSQATGKGRHTTTQLQIVPVEALDRGAVADTPGMREFALWQTSEAGGLANLFREMRPFIGACQFGLDCTHTHEPNCAIQRAVDRNEISEERYDSYSRMLASDE